MTAPAQASLRHAATGGQIDALASAHVAFASFLLDMRELAPVHPIANVVSFHLPDKAALEAFAAALGMPVVAVAGQWRAARQFGKALTYVLWTEDVS